MARSRSVLEQTRSIAAGDAEAFAAFYEVWFDRVVLDVRRFTGRDESFAFDVAQEVMMSVIWRMRPMSSEGEVRAWLRRVATRRALSHLRAERRAARRALAAAGQRPRGVAPAADAESIGEQRRWLAGAFGAENATHARMVEARFRFGWTLGRIGEAFGVSTSAADGLIGRAIARAKRKADRDGFTNDD
jgi:RNA polymerase sigma factor (sigma-70 family)